MSENINNSYFDGHYKDIWRAIIPTELTAKETEFMIQHFNLQPGSKVLDIMCGYGRHAISLAEKDISVTAVDNLGEYISEIKEKSIQHNLDIKVSKADITNFKSGDSFDLAICMGNSLNFFASEQTIAVLQSLSTQIKEGGHLLINTWSLAEIAIKHFIERSWAEVNGYKILTACQYLFNPTRIEAETTIISAEKVVESKKAVDYVFSVSEIQEMLKDSGFTLKEIYSIPGRKKFRLGDARAYIVAEKYLPPS
jgi:2-polyprenyl-3-methyl-5-hydroxy-6-metoxy-1,4-benzoquinol methylase